MLRVCIERIDLRQRRQVRRAAHQVCRPHPRYRLNNLCKPPLACSTRADRLRFGMVMVALVLERARGPVVVDPQQTHARDVDGRLAVAAGGLWREGRLVLVVLPRVWDARSLYGLAFRTHVDPQTGLAEGLVVLVGLGLVDKERPADTAGVQGCLTRHVVVREGHVAVGELGRGLVVVFQDRWCGLRPRCGGCVSSSIMSKLNRKIGLAALSDFRVHRSFSYRFP